MVDTEDKLQQHLKKVQKASSFAEKLQFEKTDKIMTYFGKNGLGMEFFCYIRCGLAGYKQMQDDYHNKVAANPEIYGEIIYKDFIQEPDEKAKAFLAEYLKK